MKALVAILTTLIVGLTVQEPRADPYVWDNQNNNGIWTDPVNWGLLNTPGLNLEPTAADSAIFRSGSPAGTVTLTGDAFAQKIRQNISAPARIVTIDANQVVDRTLTLSGTTTELIECTAATANFTFSGTPNTNGARLRLQLNGTGTGLGTPVNAGVTLAVNCDVSGVGGFILNAGDSGAGTLTLGGSNTYSGPTTVNAGTLFVNGSITAASTVSVAAGAKLGGSGTIGGSVTISTNGNLQPGNLPGAIGSFAINGSLTFAGNLHIEVNKSLSVSNDTVVVAGILNNTGSGTIAVTNLNPAMPLLPGDSFKLFNKPVLNGQLLSIVSSGGEFWTNRLAIDGSIAIRLPTNAPPAPTALAATSVGSNSFTANWTAASSATGYRLDVSTNNFFSSFLSGYQDLDVGSVLSLNVSGLNWGTNYYRVRAYNGAGTSGNSASILVPPAGPGFPGDPTNIFVWNCTSDTDQNWSSPSNWVGNIAPQPGSSSIVVFRGDVLVPWNWPRIDADYGATILIFSNDVRLNGIKITGGVGHTMKLGSYVLNDQPPNAESPSYFGIDSDIDIPWAGRGGGNIHSVNANFTNALGDATCGSQTDFKCVGARLDVYGVLKDGAGTSSKLIKSGDRTLNITGQWPNTYTGGTIVQAGPIKMQKPAGYAAIPGDVTVNGTGGLVINVLGGEQIANQSIVTLNDSGYVDLINQPETVQAIQSTSVATRIVNVGSTLTVAPVAGGTYNGGVGESDFAGAISGNGTLQMNGSGVYGLLGTNAVANLTVNSGTLKVNGNSGTGAVTINAGGTLLGKATLAGPVTVASGATLGAGFSAGGLNLSAGMNFSAGGNGATNVWELAALRDDNTGVDGVDFDQIVLTGGILALGAQSTLDIRFIGAATAPDASNPFWQTAHSWTIISLNGGNNPGASNFGRIKNANHAAGNFTTTASASGIVLSFTPTIVISPTPPRITAIASAGTDVTTVSYTNTWPGTNYLLSYLTNLISTNWFPAGNKTATGTSDSQNDNAATNRERYYRIQFLKP